MNEFKEWLSDYLRYFMLAAAVLLLFGIIMIVTNVYRSVQQTDDQEVIQILTETETDTDFESVTEVETEKVTETVTETEVFSESAEEYETEEMNQNEMETQTESEKESETEFQTEMITETETEVQTEYVPKYKTLIGSCYIRSEPSMESEILGEYIYGTTVEFLEDVGGWYKVQIDGMTGYMGARFFED